MSQTVTAAQIRSIAGPGARGDLVSAIVAGWPVAVQKAKLSTRNRAAHFLAQIMTETGGLKILEESGAYRAPRILAIFGEGHHSARITPAEAQRIAALPLEQRGPVLFNRVYGVGNPSKMREFQNTGPNDGWLYRGGGLMQATGKSNYAVLAKKTGLPLVEHPELLHSPGSAFTAAYLEWAQDGRCNAAADRDDAMAVRKIINGGTNGMAECRAYVMKAKSVLADYGGAAPPVIVPAAPEPQEAEPVPLPVPRPTVPEPAAVTTDPAVTGDPELFSIQKRLKARNYSPGVLDGLWGSGTSGALGGFINDRGGHIPVPASLDAFNSVREDIKAELGRAESESWFRPVSAARAGADSKTVATVAPEVVPMKRNFLVTAWGAAGTFLYGLYNSVSGYITQAWDFFTDHKDDLPSDPSYLSTAWEYLGKVPTTFWILLAASGLVFVALDARKSVNKITQSVQTGERQ